MRRAAVLAAASAGVACPLLACQLGGVPRDELPEAPIAFLRYDEEAARLRAQELSDEVESLRAKAEEKVRSRFENRAVAEVDGITAYLEGLAGGEPARRDPDVQGELALLHPRSGEIESIVEARPGALPMQWSPDRSRLLFVQILDLYPRLFEYHRETGVVTPVSKRGRAHPQGCYGPDGRVVVADVDIRPGHGESRVALLERGGRGLRVLSAPDRRARYPACAPDGSAVAWIDEGGRRPRLFVQSPPGEGEPRDLGPGRDPFFSPDGEWIVYSAPAGHRQWRLARIRADGTGRTPLGRGGRNEFRPSVSPDGRHVVYVAERDFRTHLYLRRFDGSGDRILLGDGAGERPVW